MLLWFFLFSSALASVFILLQLAIFDSSYSLSTRKIASYESYPKTSRSMILSVFSNSSRVLSWQVPPDFSRIHPIHYSLRRWICAICFSLLRCWNKYSINLGRFQVTHQESQNHSVLRNYRVSCLFWWPGSVRKPHHRCQFRDFSRYFVGASLQMPPLWGLGFWLMYVSTQMPSLWD